MDAIRIQVCAVILSKCELCCHFDYCQSL